MTDEIKLDPATSRRIEGGIASMAGALKTERGELDRRVGQLLATALGNRYAVRYSWGSGDWVQLS